MDICLRALARVKLREIDSPTELGSPEDMLCNVCTELVRKGILRAPDSRTRNHQYYAGTITRLSSEKHCPLCRLILGCLNKKFHLKRNRSYLDEYGPDGAIFVEKSFHIYTRSHFFFFMPRINDTRRLEVCFEVVPRKRSAVKSRHTVNQPHLDHGSLKQMINQCQKTHSYPCNDEILGSDYPIKLIDVAKIRLVDATTKTCYIAVELRLGQDSTELL
jgi:hypothetical protein